MAAITVRQMHFDFPDDVDPIVVEGDPEHSYLMLGFSLLLPYLEPYLIRTMKEAKPLLRDPQLVEDLEKFNAQEGQHYRQHRRFNDVVRKRLPDVQALEDGLEADYRRFSRTKPLRFNLAYAEGFEALTTATALFSFEKGFGPMHPALADLFSWHLVEEIEHRTVAFDVYDHVVGRYPYRLAVGLFAQWHMARFMARAAALGLRSNAGVLERFGGKAARRARTRAHGRLALRHLLPRVLKTYTPWYTPHDIPMPPALTALGERYTRRAARGG
jgi:hypothetical protein